MLFRSHSLEKWMIGKLKHLKPVHEVSSASDTEFFKSVSKCLIDSGDINSILDMWEYLDLRVLFEDTPVPIQHKILLDIILKLEKTIPWPTSPSPKHKLSMEEAYRAGYKALYKVPMEDLEIWELKFLLNQLCCLMESIKKSNEKRKKD